MCTSCKKISCIFYTSGCRTAKNSLITFAVDCIYPKISLLNYLSVEQLSKSFGENPLFTQLQFGLSKGSKTALIAKNGAGKSTLLKILAGEEHPDDGKVVIRNDVTVGFLAQTPSLPATKTIEAFIASGNQKMYKIIQDYENALNAQTEKHSDKTQSEFERATEAMDKEGGWDYELRMEQILSEFHIHDLSQIIDTLSGGEKKRLALAEVLIDNPDFLLLDEPTNHLDIQIIEWLEKYLIQSKMTLLMVTHDRFFLDRVCDHILELEDGVMYHHKGNYEKFLVDKASREESFEAQQQKSRQFLKKEVEWIRRSPKARTSKSKSRIDAFYDVKENVGRSSPKKELQLDVKMSRIGGSVLEMKNATKSFAENTILKDFSYTFKKGDRIGLLGKNGIGKSTFLNLISGKETIDSGDIKKGETIRFGYYTQQGIQLEEDKRVIDVLKSSAEVISLSNGKELSASQFLEYFLFPPDLQYTYVSKLSGGEKRRLTLLMVLIQNPNFLILDEPTNDLDLFTLEKLEEFLQAFSGCLMIVSHDRYFMEKLVDHYFVFHGDGVLNDFNGNYQEYSQLQKTKAKTDTKQKKEKLQKVKAKRSFKENQEYNELEGSIDLLEKEKKALETELNKGSEDYQELEDIGKRIREVDLLIDEKTFRWLELDEME